MNTLFGKTIRGGVSVALLGALLACGRNEAVENEGKASSSPTSVTGEISALNVSPERMLSRSAPVPEEPVEERATVQAPVVKAVSDEKPTAGNPHAARVVYRYVQPRHMISEKDVREFDHTLDQAMTEKLPAQSTRADDSRLSDMVAMAYVRKSSMLSSGQYDADRTGKAYSPNDGIGFFDEEEMTMMFDEAGLLPDRQADAGDDPEKVQQAIYFVREAESRFAKGMLAEAEIFYSKALELFPDTTYVNKRLGHICLARGDYERAIIYFSAALDTDEHMAVSLNELGIAYLYAGQNEKALENFTAAINADDEFVEPIYNAGLALRQLRRPQDARAKIEEFLKREPADPRGYRELAMLSLVEENTQDALEMLERAMLLDDSWSMPYLDAAAIHVASTNYIEALRSLDAALERTTATRVFRLYNTPKFQPVRLIPESVPFEARLTSRLRALL